MLHFRQGNSDKMVIKNGKLGIGTSDPKRTLDVNGQITFGDDVVTNSTPRYILA